MFSSRILLACAVVTAVIASSTVAFIGRDTADASVTPVAPSALPADADATRRLALPGKPQPDRSGLRRVGVASFYADWFAGREMADGTPMDPGGDNAASRTLPIGTTAKVTNMATGQSAVITIQDRGPYAKGRLVDLSPATARKIGISPRLGVARVSVSPIQVPLPDGSVKPGVAAADPEVARLR
jgi:rare lipoprotein A